MVGHPGPSTEVIDCGFRGVFNATPYSTSQQTRVCITMVFYHSASVEDAAPILKQHCNKAFYFLWPAPLIVKAIHLAQILDKHLHKTVTFLNRYKAALYFTPTGV